MPSSWHMSAAMVARDTGSVPPENSAGVGSRLNDVQHDADSTSVLDSMAKISGSDGLAATTEEDVVLLDDDGKTEVEIGGAGGTDKSLENALKLKESLEFDGGGSEADNAISVAELVAKSRAPVKREYLSPPQVKVPASNGVTGTNSNEVWNENAHSRVAALQAKSKRQQKRERLQAKKSPVNICAILARTGDSTKCPYGASCRFNHDLEAYKAQKPPDLPGTCPNLDYGEPCSYGVACRFAGSHKKLDGFEKFQQRKSCAAVNELNTLSKDLQKLLWKNRASFPKADAQLKAMGLMNKAYKLRNVGGEDNESGVTNVREENPLENEQEIGAETCRNTLNSGLEGTSAPPMTSVSSKDQGFGSLDIEGTMCDVPQALICKSEPLQESCPVLSNALDCSVPPQKRLRTVMDGAIMDDMVAMTTKDSRCDFEVQKDVSNTTEVDESKMSCMMDVSVPAEEMICQEGDVKYFNLGQLTMEQDDAKSKCGKDDWGFFYVESKLGTREKKIIDFRQKLYLAPLTTVGNLPFRRVCKALGAEITCGEMAICTSLLQGQASEWALLRRDSSEDLFGVQICGSFPDHVARTAELIERECTVDFIDINMGCPIDLVVNKGAGSCLLTKPQRLEQLVRVTAAVIENPLTLKLRMGYYEGRNCAHTLMPNLSKWGVNAVTIHGRTRQQRYSKVADWTYIQQCAAAVTGNVQVIGNGDVFSHTDWNEHMTNTSSRLSTCMIARGALIKPWIFTEIKEGRHWDISSGERLDILRQYVHSGLTHWGSDSKGVETTRHFLLEWLSYLHRYIPVGVLEALPQQLNWRPPSYFGRNDLETMMASESAADWVRISELLLGPTPADFIFKPKHKSNSYDRPENG